MTFNDQVETLFLMLGEDRVMPHHPGEVGGQERDAEIVVDPDSAAPETGAETED